ncbi:hypothetical protein MNBD_CHLOROFLEXI01-1991 [hydrothermal vent metagenome]|uniref:DUF5671 domain-containing protein n=1 Tax=hydrothermal vent metagenome TaxID=652676 RepID=A0A3B0V204_9ZZZZ
MIKIRRWYIFFVTAISLNIVVWGIIALLRNLFIRGLNTSKTQIALGIAIIIIGLPFYLVHWLWAQRLAEKDDEERHSDLRSFYLYGMMVSFLAPFANNAFGLIVELVRQILGVERRGYYYPKLSPSVTILYHLVALVVLASFWFYHYRLVSSESAPQTDSRATDRRLYIYGFSAVGLTLTIIGFSSLLNWLLFQFGDSVPSKSGLPTTVTQLLLGIPLWIIFWRQGQRLFHGPDRVEQESVLRKAYLYLAVFMGVMTAVTTTTILFAAWLRGLLGLTTSGDIRDPLSIIVGALILWVFHAYALQEDASAATEHPRQAGIRRLYLYLVAGVGLAALLIGLAGEISVLIRSLAEGTTIVNDLREGLAWFTAALIAGLPVWLIPWQKVQAAAVSKPTSVDERQSLVRRIYLYFYLFVAAMTMLASAIYIVSQLVELLLGVRDAANLLTDLGHAIAFTLIAVGVWMVHWTTLRQDGRFLQEAESQKLKTLHVVVLDNGDNGWGAIVRDELSRELLQVNLQQANLMTPQPTEAEAQPPLIDALAQADVIIGPWTMAVEKEVGTDVATAVANSPARKLLIPIQNEDWNWIGVPRQNVKTTVKEIIHALKQIAAGEDVAGKRPY